MGIDLGWGTQNSDGAGKYRGLGLLKGLRCIFPGELSREDVKASSRGTSDIEVEFDPEPAGSH